jgi:heterodisulfide reductase subunit C2
MAETLELASGTFLREVERRSNTPVSACLQCHKCSTGCPVAPETDFLSSQVMRMINLGLEDELLASRAIWLCASCATCTTRCPMGIDIAAVMDTLRILAIEKKIAVPDVHGKRFNQSFLTSVRWHGRVFEMGMMTLYKLTSLDLFSDLDKVPKMLMKRKLSLLPHLSSGIGPLRRIFNRADQEEKKR